MNSINQLGRHKPPRGFWRAWFDSINQEDTRHQGNSREVNGFWCMKLLLDTLFQLLRPKITIICRKRSFIKSWIIRRQTTIFLAPCAIHPNRTTALVHADFIKTVCLPFSSMTNCYAVVWHEHFMLYCFSVERVFDSVSMQIALLMVHR